ncbi:transcription antitermination factor NusB [Lachnospiraceae bacterium MD1]|uniref:Transcription antitermination protein NusB n=1 Tax=Variimorphobacter saccharofermentans TaxID=2755051 RepID=A0A839JY83_9FIRM|nr:transcription antitermination factor NusB [Variimorphobacter saccharofermentans]MBB2182390.1 transcription antitermination factor NusB [Variimorphobacter saccharofermentans]
MTRREIREHIFLMLFRKDFHEATELTEQMELYIAELETPSLEEYTYLTNRFQTVVSHLEEIDQTLSEAASGWKLNRMNKVDLTILRLAVYEMKFDEDVPVKVAINEAVEMAKTFGGDESPSFVNGVLAKLA